MRRNKKQIHPITRGTLLFVNIILILALCIVIANIITIATTKGSIWGSIENHNVELTEEEIRSLSDFDADCIMVLGASVYPNGEPSPMLRDRLDAGIALYEAGVCGKLLLSGDGEQDQHYDELEVMTRYVVEHGVKKEDIYCDTAGFNTYASIYRAEQVFCVERMIIVTQRYHLYRALYGTKHTGLDAVGVASDQERYLGQFLRDCRELLARTKDIGEWIIKPAPEVLGDPIPITGPGNVEE